MFFSQRRAPRFGRASEILAAAPVIREMILYGTRWPITRQTSDPTANAFFDVLANLVADWIDHELPLHLPTSSDPVVAAAMVYVNDHLSAVSEAALCSAIGVSERTLRRRFAASTRMTWRRYVVESRLLRAMARLAESSESVTAVSIEVGFGNVSSFTRAFRSYVGETPTTYRDRVNGT